MMTTMSLAAEDQVTTAHRARLAYIWKPACNFDPLTGAIGVE